MKIPLRSDRLPACLMFISAACFGLQSCSKSGDPVIINASSITKSVVTVPLYTGNTNGSHTNNGSTGGNTGNNSDNGGSTGGGTNTGGGSSTETINTNGDGGVAIGADNTLTFTIQGQKHTLSLSAGNPILCSYDESGPVAQTFVTGVDLFSGLTVTILAECKNTGVYNIKMMEITLPGPPDAAYVNNPNSIGRINFNTYNKVIVQDQEIVNTRGTFDTILYDAATLSTPVKVSGSFNIKL